MATSHAAVVYRDHPVCDAADSAEISEETAIQIYQFFRDVCSTKLLQSLIILGGPGVVVQADESLFNHEPKIQCLVTCKLLYRYWVYHGVR